MAKKWTPPANAVGGKEPIGRRLFHEPMLAGTLGQPSFDGLDLRNFEQVRDDPEFSVDRLGSTGIVKSVREYLRERAEWEGSKRTRRFDGWIWRTAEDLAKGYKHHSFPVTPSPISGEGLSENKYHAHIVIPGEQDSTVNALLLRRAFATKGKLERIEHSSLWLRIRGWLKSNILGRSW